MKWLPFRRRSTTTIDSPDNDAIDRSECQREKEDEEKREARERLARLQMELEIRTRRT